SAPRVPVGLDAVKSRAATAIAVRQQARSARSAQLDAGTGYLTATDRDRFIGLFAADRNGPAAPGEKIAAECRARHPARRRGRRRRPGLPRRGRRGHRLRTRRGSLRAGPVRQRATGAARPAT
ncbi:MAG: hypothetical protein P8Z68_07820, partial [Kineosporiaceae bacterium]